MVCCALPRFLPLDLAHTRHVRRIHFHSRVRFFSRAMIFSEFLLSPVRTPRSSTGHAPLDRQAHWDPAPSTVNCEISEDYILSRLEQDFVSKRNLCCCMSWTSRLSLACILDVRFVVDYYGTFLPDVIYTARCNRL